MIDHHQRSLHLPPSLTHSPHVRRKRAPILSGLYFWHETTAAGSVVLFMIVIIFVTWLITLYSDGESVRERERGRAYPAASKPVSSIVWMRIEIQSNIRNRRRRQPRGLFINVTKVEVPSPLPLSSPLNYLHIFHAACISLWNNETKTKDL